MKIHIRFLFLIHWVLLLFLHSSCQKKEALQAEEPVPIDTVQTLRCPDCEFPDTVWKSNSSEKQLIFRLKFDSSQARLNDQGQISVPPVGAGVQSPSITGMSIDYIELMQNANTLPGEGILVYKTNETSCGGSKATNFCKGFVIKENEVLVSVNLNAIPPGSYPWIRISIGYQEMMIQARTSSSGNAPASFAGFSSNLTYFSKSRIQGTVLTPSLGGTGNKNRGYWLFDQKVFSMSHRLEGQAPYTTVVNPNPQISNTPAQSFVYGQFVNSSTSLVEPLTISANEVVNREILLFFSCNQSFEWKEVTSDGIFEPAIGESVLDFGCRGLIPKF